MCLQVTQLQLNEPRECQQRLQQQLRKAKNQHSRPFPIILLLRYLYMSFDCPTEVVVANSRSLTSRYSSNSNSALATSSMTGKNATAPGSGFFLNAPPTSAPPTKPPAA
mmetsp:Transcript_21230/g.61794  ORF Transcript_21230/g.61794 Transcript_21230/m.61794 type:complete len:109 (+) Transcript_21230:518-844(+)